MVRRLVPDEWETYQRVRLLALQSDPAAFSSTLIDEAKFDETRWRQRLHNAVFIGEAAGEGVGLAAGIKAPEGDGAELVSMWVAPAWRGSAVAGRLIGSVREWAASSGYDSLTLWVVEGNERAERAYAKRGFVRTGRRQPVREGEAPMEFQMAVPL